MNFERLHEIFGNSGANSNGTVHPSGKFSDKRQYLSRYFLFLGNFSTICPHLQRQAPLTVILPKKNAQDLPGGRWWQTSKTLSIQCVFLLVGSVSGCFGKKLRSCRWKRIKFCGRYLCFSFTYMIRASSVLLSWSEGKQCGCRLLVPLTKCGCCSCQKKKLSSSSPKKIEFSRSSDKTLCTETPTHWGPTGIRKFRSNLFRFLSGKKCSSICPEKTTENSILC